MPGGGQVGLSAPPPPPPPNPEPVVVTVDGAGGAVEVAPPASDAGPDRGLAAAMRLLEFDEPADAETYQPDAPDPAAAARWTTFRALVERFLASLVAGWSDRGLVASEEPPGDELGGGDVLDGQPDRLEDRDGVGRTGRNPAGLDAADLHKVAFRN